MKYRELKCRNCGGPIKLGRGVTRIKCDYCGTEYALSNASAQTGPAPSIKQFEYMGRGALFESFVPQGWSGRVIDDNDSASMLAAICKGLQLDSPAGERMLFYPFAYFKSFTPGALGLRKNYTLDPATLIRYRQRPGIEDYARERISELIYPLDDLQLQRIPDRDGILARRTALFCNDAAKCIKKPLNGACGKFKLHFCQNGVAYSGFFASGSVFIHEEPKAVPQPSAPVKTGGGGLLDKALNYKGLFGGPSINDMRQGVPAGGLGSGILGGLGGMLSGHDWARAFDFVLITPQRQGEADEALFDEFCASLAYGSLYFALQDEEMAQVRQIQLQGAQQRQQIAINAQRELHRTQSQTSDIINSGYRERSARMDQTRKNYSEAVRGVNSYVNNYGQTVEADVKYEHVYQKGDYYAGSTDGGVELGAQWQELKRER